MSTEKDESANSYGFNRTTAGFIGAILEALPEDVSATRMTELVRLPRKLKALLLALRSDRLLPIASRVLAQQNGEKKPVIELRVTTASSANSPTLRSIMDEAYDRCLAPLPETEALLIVRELEQIGRSGWGNLGSYTVPFLREGELRIATLRCSTAATEKVSHEWFNRVDETLRDTTFLFEQGFIDRSDCYKCQPVYLAI